ncbi:MAG: NUDIX hydrolase [Solobacterium sp.]|nr:NUDIX hydrolase [Solobacterium sp.]
MDMKEKTLKKNTVYDGHIIKVRLDEALSAEGDKVPREVVEHPGGVGIALEDEEGKFFFVTQYRYAQEEIMLEYPAGKKEPGEDPMTTAKREIIEETGYEGVDFVRLGAMVPTPAYDTEVIDLYYARQGRFLGQHLDSDEYIHLSKLTMDEITEKIVSGEVSDAKTIGMTFLIKEFKARGKI